MQTHDHHSFTPIRVWCVKYVSTIRSCRGRKDDEAHDLDPLEVLACVGWRHCRWAAAIPLCLEAAASRASGAAGAVTKTDPKKSILILRPPGAKALGGFFLRPLDMRKCHPSKVEWLLI